MYHDMHGQTSHSGLSAVVNCNVTVTAVRTKMTTASSHSENGSFLTSGFSWLCHLCNYAEVAGSLNNRRRL